MPPARSPRTEPANPQDGSPEATIGHDGAVTGATGEVAPRTHTSLRALARLLARQAAAEHCATAETSAATTDTIPDAPVRDAA